MLIEVSGATSSHKNEFTVEDEEIGIIIRVMILVSSLPNVPYLRPKKVEQLSLSMNHDIVTPGSDFRWAKVQNAGTSTALSVSIR